MICSSLNLILRIESPWPGRFSHIALGPKFLEHVTPPTGHFYFAENRTFLNWFDISTGENLPSNGGISSGLGAVGA